MRFASEAARIWLGPKDPPAAARTSAEDDEDRSARGERRRRFWVAFKDHLAANHSELPAFEPRSRLLIRLPSGVPHIGFEVHFLVRPPSAGVDIWFWREASTRLWERIRSAPDQYNALIGAPWEFRRVAGSRRAWMTVERPASLRDERSWPELYRWLGEKLSLLYSQVQPKLLGEMLRF